LVLKLLSNLTKMIPPLKDRISSAAKPLPPISDESFGSHFDWLGKYRLVLLGDASHGTSEFYEARAEISKQLVAHHGFNVIALEADWPDAAALDRYVRQRPGPQAKLEAREVPFRRFPTWMWRNKEMQDLVHWLRDYNADLPTGQRAGIYGLDLYSMGRSMHAVIEYLERVDPEKARVARKRYGCLEPWLEDPSMYGLATMKQLFESCEKHVIKMLQDLLAKRLQYSTMMQDGEEFHSAEQNANVVVDAEEYYRAMYYNSALSWNLRDTHMFETLERLLNFKKNAKVIVWAHNSHLGDARYTSMGRIREEINLGQLCRQNFGDEVAIVGCGTHTGTVAAAHEWDGNMNVMNVNPSRKDSYEWVAHEVGMESFLLDLRNGVCDKELREELSKERLERFIGVIYRPHTERWSHYSGAMLAKQFDAYLWFDKTKA
jgi:erythromycin esterase-like protein